MFGVLLAASIACGRTTRPSLPTADATVATAVAESAPVPESYRLVYDSLAEGLAAWETRLEGMPPSTGTMIFGAELLVANGNRGAALLQPATLAGVRVYLDRLQELGVGGVSVAISDPLLWPE